MRNIMSFETSNNFLDQFEQKRPVMVAWEHIPGATVHTGLFNEYQLPNGRKTFFYYSTTMLEETPVRFCLHRPVPKPNRIGVRWGAATVGSTDSATRSHGVKLQCAEWQGPHHP